MGKATKTGIFGGRRVGTRGSHMKDSNNVNKLIQAGAIHYHGHPMAKPTPPYKWIWFYKKDKEGKYLLRKNKAGKPKLVIDHEKSGWVENASFAKVYNRSAKMYCTPNTKPKKITDNIDYFYHLKLSFKNTKVKDYSVMSLVNKVKNIVKANF